MATAALTPVPPPRLDLREVVRCPACQLTQFKTQTGDCRRCTKPLQLAEVVEQLAPLPDLPAIAESGDVLSRLPGRIRDLRIGRGYSQRELAERMNVPRTYISKLENGKGQPTLSSLDRLGKALRVPLAAFVEEGDAVTAALRTDPFLAELAPLLAQVTEIEMRWILDAARQAAARNREAR